jgi:putative nucleotidyltransferase with HDIG domain
MGIDSLAMQCLRNMNELQRTVVSFCIQGLQDTLASSWIADCLPRLSAGEVDGLQVLVSAYDRGTNEHALRTAVLVAAVARQMGCTQEEIALSGLAALLHDIGKAAIPAPILCKPEPLDAQERKIMQLHPEIGSCMLSQVGGSFAGIGHIVVAHHERWDGEGYPAGLACEDIPLPARILAVVDSFDAMTSTRVYQQKRSVTEARLELLFGAGYQYDPRVVTAFIALLDRARSCAHRLPVLESVKRSHAAGETESADAKYVEL